MHSPGLFVVVGGFRGLVRYDHAGAYFSVSLAITSVLGVRPFLNGRVYITLDQLRGLVQLDQSWIALRLDVGQLRGLVQLDRHRGRVRLDVDQLRGLVQLDRHRGRIRLDVDQLRGLVQLDQ